MCNIPGLSTQLDLLLTLRELPISMSDLQPVSLAHCPWRQIAEPEWRVLKVCPHTDELPGRTNKGCDRHMAERGHANLMPLMQILMWRHTAASEVNEKTIWGQSDINTWKLFCLRKELWVWSGRWSGYFPICWIVKRLENRKAWKAL